MKDGSQTFKSGKG